MTVQALLEEYEANPRAADARYKGKSLAPEGSVRDVDIFAAGLVSVRIGGNSTDSDRKQPSRTLRCEFVAASTPRLTNLERGQKLSFNGKCNGDRGTFIDFVECEVIEVGAVAALSVTAAQLTRDFVDNEKAALGRYKDRVLVVVGVVAEWKESGGVQRLLLRGHNEKSPVPVRVLADYREERKQDFARLKKGDKIQIRGDCAGLFLGEVLIRNAKRIE
jgi:hypothetical protein